MHIAEVWAVGSLLLLVRVAAFVMASPLFGDQSVPRLVKVGLSVSLTTFWFFRYAHEPSDAIVTLTQSTNAISYFLAAGKEIVIGGALGLAFGLVLVPARIAGAYIGQEMGLSLATITDPEADASSTVLGQIFFSLAVLTFLSLDIDHAMLAALHTSLANWPLAAASITLPWGGMASELTTVSEVGLLLAAPVGICLFVTTVVLALLMKASPQFNLFSIGLPTRIVAGLFSMLVFLPDTIAVLGNLLIKTADAITSMSFL